jgi:hypothetical protein
MPGRPELPNFVNLHSQLAAGGASLWPGSHVNIDARVVQTKKKRRISPALCPFQIGKAGLAARDLPRGHEAENQEDQEDHKEDPDQRFGDRERCAGYAAKAQNGGNKTQNQKQYGETQHGVSSK